MINYLVCNVKIGEKLIVNGITHIPATVESMEFLPNEARWQINLDWGEYGKSKVYSSDYMKIWYKLENNN